MQLNSAEILEGSFLGCVVMNSAQDSQNVPKNVPKNVPQK
jgi:hypothetical protein